MVASAFVAHTRSVEGNYSTGSGLNTSYVCLLIQQVTDFIIIWLNMCTISVRAAEFLIKVYADAFKKLH